MIASADAAASAFGSLAPPSSSAISTEIIDDPTLSSCCQKDAIANKLATNKDKILRENDRVSKAVKMQQDIDDRVRGVDPSITKSQLGGFDWKKKFAYLNSGVPSGGCRCCFVGGSNNIIMAQNEAEGYEGFRKAREKFGPTQGRIIDSSGGFWGEREGVVTCGFVNSDDEDEGENKNKPPLEEDSQDSDSDSGEFDYLLDEPLPQHSFETQQIILDNSELTYLQNLHAFGALLTLPSSQALQKILKQQESFKREGMPGSDDCIVIHVFDHLSTDDGVFDVLLEGVGKRFRGTRFLNVDVSVARSPLWVNGGRFESGGDIIKIIRAIGSAPSGTVFCVQNAEITNQSSAYELNFTTERQIESWLDSCGILSTASISRDRICELLLWKEGVADVFSGVADNEVGDHGAEFEQEQFFDCGKEGCCKTFAHQHIGEVEGSQGQMVREGIDSVNI